ncbi:MAG TPA: sigma-70 family RNA polymerase sigma factor [Gaiellaceae bacterium]|nr:sigma-70 family RNA polymerase sigma factor [Gaiellaceae bacterium]
MTRPPATSDAELVRRCREGDRAAWDQLVERYSRYVYGICVRVFRLPESDAEDVFQEVFARVFARLDTLRDEAALRPWIAQLTRRLCLDTLAGASRERPSPEPVPEAVEAALEELDDAFAVREALARLPEPCREMLDRFFARDQSYRTISAELDLPAGTIASRIARCLRKLRLELEGRSDSEAPSRE